jgi:hypothetical protein
VALQSAASIATTVTALRQYDSSKPIVLLEGHTDAMLYAHFFVHDSAFQHVVCEGKRNLIGAAEILADRGAERVLAICDADYDRVLAKPMYRAVLMTDLHDSEMFAISSAALDRVVSELLFAIQVQDPNAATKVRDRSLEVAQQVGNLRVENERNHLCINFKAVSAGDFANSEWTFSLGEYVAALLAASSGMGCSPADLVRIANGPAQADPLDLINGHDLAGLIGGFARVPFGFAPVSRDYVEGLMRLALWPDEFGRTQLYRSIREWEDQEDVDILSA